MIRRVPAAVLARVAGLALAAALGLLPALAPTPVAAARPDLTVVGHATYDVLPAEGRVAVTVRLRARNHLRDTVTRRFFFRHAFLTVLPDTTNFRISGGRGSPKVEVTRRKPTYTNLRIDLGADLAAGRSTTLTLRFDVVDRGGAPDRALRISPSIVSFSAWAFATPDTPGASVAVRIPAGYRVTIGRGPLQGPTTTKSGEQEWTSGRLDDPVTFLADVSADRDVAPVETAGEVELPAGGAASVVVRSWPDDTAWRDRVLGLVQRALPVLEEEIGVAWPIEGPLVLEESLSRGPDGYAGLFDPAEGRIEVSYAASDVIVMHELAHAWFNGRLVADRWAAEAFASHYADAAAARLGMAGSAPEPVDPSVPEAIPLNAWGDATPPESEAYAYAASRELARQVAARAGGDRLRMVWARAAAGVPAYPASGGEEPAGDPPASPGAPDWRGLLDLLEEHAGGPFDDLWRTWVARPEDLAALDDRARARAAYAATVEAAGEWRLPEAIRESMRAWQFTAALGFLRQADDVLARRDALEASAAEAGVTLPGRLHDAFEGPGTLAQAATEAAAEQEIVDAILAAEAARPAVGDPVEGALVFVGLIAADPEGRLGLARVALSAGDLRTALVAASAAEASWAGAEDAGRTRLISGTLLAIALMLGLGLFRQWRRGSPGRGAASSDADEAQAAPGDQPPAGEEPATASDRG